MTTTLADRQAKLVDLVRTYQAGLWRYVRFLGCEACEAEDLVQDTFLVAFQEEFEHRSAAETGSYLRTVARHRLLMLRRKQGGRCAATLLAPSDLDDAEAYWAEVAHDDGLDGYLSALRQCLDSAITPRVRRALEMQYAEEAIRDTIATALDLSVEGVKTLVRRAKATLRDCIQRRLGS